MLKSQRELSLLNLSAEKYLKNQTKATKTNKTTHTKPKCLPLSQGFNIKTKHNNMIDFLGLSKHWDFI